MPLTKTLFTTEMLQDLLRIVWGQLDKGPVHGLVFYDLEGRLIEVGSLEVVSQEPPLVLDLREQPAEKATPTNQQRVPEPESMASLRAAYGV